MNWNDKEVLITGGTGSLGKTLINKLCQEYHPRGIRVYSRDELKQWELKKECKEKGFENIAFIPGDVRDKERLKMALKGVDIVINAAAMKQVGSCEENPIEAIKTNIIGCQNIMECSIENGVEKVMHVSTDKACLPVNLYGATKLCTEKLFVNGNVYTGGHGTKFSVCRYGNVLGSRGSVIPLWKKQKLEGNPITITDKRMTRFFITLDEVASFLLGRCEVMQGGEIFIPKMRTAKMIDIAEMIADGSDIIEIGMQDGEKLHECLISEEESRSVYEYANHFERKNFFSRLNSFSYTSNDTFLFLTKEELETMIFAECVFAG